MAFLFAGVSIVPGRMTLARTSASLFSAATVLICDTMAAFDALYAPTPTPGSTAARLPMAMIRPFPAWRSAGSVARST